MLNLVSPIAALMRRKRGAIRSQRKATALRSL